MFRIETYSDLPVGQNESDYFHDRGEFLKRGYRSATEARKAWKKNFKGPDVDGNAVYYEIVEEWEPDRGYAAGYAYASGYHD